MPFHTYRRADGSYYDASHPECERDTALPLRPSDLYEWERDRWVWQGQRITHETLALAGAGVGETVTFADLRDVMQVLNEQIETSQYQSRAMGEMRETVATVLRMLHEHLDEAKPLLETLRGLQAISKAAGAVSRVLRGAAIALRVVFKTGLVITGLYALLWALMHGDSPAIKRALSMLLTLPPPPGS